MADVFRPGRGPAGRPLVFVVFGAGGVGKGALVARLLGLTDSVWLSRSWTTRPRRPGEPEDAYVFTSPEAFMERVQAGGFIEWNKFSANGHLYGTPTLEPPPGHDVLLEIDLNGAEQIRRRYPEAVLIMVMAPSAQARAARLHKRGDDQAAIQRRLQIGAEEEEAGRRVADYVVVNDNLERAARELAAIVGKRREQA
jgi:guanylate kinase